MQTRGEKATPNVKITSLSLALGQVKPTKTPPPRPPAQPSFSPTNITHGGDFRRYAMRFRVCSSRPADAVSILSGRLACAVCKGYLCRSIDGAQGSRVKWVVSTEAGM
jgi:hypothetical protein